MMPGQHCAVCDNNKEKDQTARFIDSQAILSVECVGSNC